jgi:hypothetical protein
MPWSRSTFSDPKSVSVRPVAAALFLFVLSQLTVTMLLGVYFLCDRLQFLDDTSV